MGITDIMRQHGGAPVLRAASIEDPAVPLTSARVLEALGGERTWSGIQVNAQKAVTYVAMHTCVKILAESLAQLPASVYERDGSGRRQADDHWLHPLLHDEANREMTCFEWLEVGGYHLGFKGNYYSEIEWNGSRDAVLGFWPLSDRTEPFRLDGEIYYKTVVKEKGAEKTVVLPAYRVLHIPGPGFDGLKGLDPLTVLRQTVAGGLALEEYGAKVISSGAAPRIILKYPTRVGKEAADRIRTEFEILNSGLSNAHRTALLEEGITFDKLTWSPSEVQALELRTYYLRDVLRFYRVPAHMAGDLERSTNNNIEHQGIEFVKFTMGPALRRWEKRLDRLLRSVDADRHYYAKFNVDGLQRGDYKTRKEGEAIEIQNGTACPDEIRARNEQNPREDGLGGRFWMPANFMLAESAASEPDGGAKRRDNLRKKDPSNPSAMRAAPEQGMSREFYRRNCQGLLEAVYGDLIRNEGAAIGKMLDRAESEGLASVQVAMEKFYGGLERKAAHRLKPVMLAFGGMVASTVSTYLQGDAAINRFSGEVAKGMARRYTEASMQQLLQAAAAGARPIDGMRAKLEEWSRCRAAVEGMNESTRAVEAFTAEAVKEARCTTES
jgi:HK97 family phage portal protein